MPSRDDRAEEALTRRALLQESRVERFRRMVEIRLIEDKIVELFGEGLIPGTTHTCQGQEAVAVGIAGAIRPSDIVTCTYRGHGVALALGVSPQAVIGEIFGRQSGCMGGLGGSMHLSEPSVGLLPTMAIVGAGIPVAVGAALTAQVAGTDAVALSVFGDGATNIGAFHEALNLAAIWRLPVVFVCENNLYGEYSRIDRTTPIRDIAVRAQSYGMRAEIVDGQSADIVEATIRQAADHARDGGGPTLIEAKTYRYSGHSRSDKAAYRPPGELDEWLRRDPISLFGLTLIAEQAIDQAGVEMVWEEERRHVEHVIETVLASPVATQTQVLMNVTAEKV
jgi:pyruvate dehydrogenase E1 component alpha subunit